MKIKRDAFLYLDPKLPLDHTFAQCGRCRMWLPDQERCTIIGPDTKVTADMSCGFFVPGDSAGLDPQHNVSMNDAGAVKRSVRCENCKFFDLKFSECILFVQLNNDHPDVWDLEIKVHPQGCCNAQVPIND
jgi:hypothetical protein